MAEDFTRAASSFARRNEAEFSREITCSISYLASCKADASDLARFPAPTIAMRGLANGDPDMPGRITEPVAEHAGPLFPASAISKLRAEFFWKVLYIVRMAKSPHSKTKAKSKGKSNSKARVISSRTVYRGPVFWVTTDQVQEPGGIRVRRDVIHHSGSVVVLAVDDSVSPPRLLLERQYRHAARDYLWELPAGRIDAGEKPLPAAKRELLEETGYTADHWRRILYFYASPGFVAETMSVFMATGLRSGKAQPEDDEIILKRMVSLPAAMRMVLKGTIRDAKTISSILWLNSQAPLRHS